MFKQFNYFVLFGIIMLSLVSCEKNNGMADGRFESALLEKYPDATSIKWSMKGNYHIAEFKSAMTRSTEMIDNQAWFDRNCQWQMTEIDIHFDMLPQAVKEAFNQSEYASWRIEDVDRLDREGMETLYIIEVEETFDGKEIEMDLFYSPDGTLIKTEEEKDIDDDYQEHLPPTENQSIETFIVQNYPNARIIDIEREDGRIEVEIIDGNFVREVLFDMNNVWILTKTDLKQSEIPSNIREAIAHSEYSTYKIEDATLVETPQIDYYEIELEDEISDHEVTLKIDTDGNII